MILRCKFIANYLDGTRIDLGACPLPTAIIIDESDFKQRYPSLLIENVAMNKIQPRDSGIVGIWRRVSIDGSRIPKPYYARYYPTGEYASWPWPVDKAWSDSHGVHRARYTIAGDRLVVDPSGEKPGLGRIRIRKDRMTLFQGEVTAVFERISPLEPGKLEGMSAEPATER
jgi:hypothetical protein